MKRLPDDFSYRIPVGEHTFSVEMVPSIVSEEGISSMFWIDVQERTIFLSRMIPSDVLPVVAALAASRAWQMMAPAIGRVA